MIATFFKKLLLNVENNVSWTKTGSLIVSIATVLLETNALPAYTTILKVIIGAGSVIFVSGVRDALPT